MASTIPPHFNDRLLLGLKGTMSEAELHVLRARLRGGILNKARRGELEMRLPIGFVYDATRARTSGPGCPRSGQYPPAVSHFPAHRLSHGDGQSVPRSRPQVPAPPLRRAAARRGAMGRFGALARALGTAPPALRWRLLLWPFAATQACRWPAQLSAPAARGVDRTDTRCARGLHQLGRVSAAPANAARQCLRPGRGS